MSLARADRARPGAACLIIFDDNMNAACRMPPCVSWAVALTSKPHIAHRVTIHIHIALQICSND